MTQTPIDSLCRELLAEFKRDSRGKEVPRLLGEYAAGHEDWREWVHFATDHYTRNLVHRCGDYELLLLCWEEGQESPIHNHAGQLCWMAVLDGCLEEVHFRSPAPGAALEAGRSARFEQGGVAFIEDEIALHLIRPVSGRGVSLHLYANPIDTCKVYDPADGAETSVELGYYSVRGQKTSEGADSVRTQFQ